MSKSTLSDEKTPVPRFDLTSLSQALALYNSKMPVEGLRSVIHTLRRGRVHASIQVEPRYLPDTSYRPRYLLDSLHIGQIARGVRTVGHELCKLDEKRTAVPLTSTCQRSGLHAP